VPIREFEIAFGRKGLGVGTPGLSAGIRQEFGEYLQLRLVIGAG
jgi:hypothetical protein